MERNVPVVGFLNVVVVKTEIKNMLRHTKTSVGKNAFNDYAKHVLPWAVSTAQEALLWTSPDSKLSVATRAQWTISELGSWGHTNSNKNHDINDINTQY